MFDENQPLPTTEMREQVQQALANLSLEGMHPSQSMLDDIELWLSNKISENEFISRGLKKDVHLDASK